MRLTAKTQALAALAAVLLLLVLLGGGGPSESGANPVIQAVTRDSVTRIELSGAEDKLVLRPVGGRWRVVAPYEADADQEAVRALLAAFRKEIAVDVQVDRGNEDQYGLEPGKGHVVEIWTSEEDPVISLTVGDDAAGGSSYVRLSGDDAVYRARLGGRARFAKAPADWRNRFVLDLDPARLTGLRLRLGQAELALSRSAGTLATEGGAATAPGPWALEPAPPWPVDQAFLDALAARLGQLRAAAILPADTPLGPEAAEVVLELDDGTTHTLRLFRAEGGPLLATADESQDRFRVPDSLLDVLPRAAEDLRDRTVLRLLREDLDTLLFEDGAGRVLLRQDAASRLWQLIQPAGLELDVKQVQVAVNILSLLRAESVAEGLAPAEAGLERPSARVTATLVDGSAEVLEIGAATTDAAGRPAWFARRAGSETVHVVSDELVKRIKAGFGRS